MLLGSSLISLKKTKSAGDGDGVGLIARAVDSEGVALLSLFPFPLALSIAVSPLTPSRPDAMVVVQGVMVASTGMVEEDAKSSRVSFRGHLEVRVDRTWYQIG